VVEEKEGLCFVELISIYISKEDEKVRLAQETTWGEALDEAPKFVCFFFFRFFLCHFSFFLFLSLSCL